MSPVTRFYAPPDQILGGQLRLVGDEARHAVRVLRHRAGDEILTIDGAGSTYRAIVTHVRDEELVADVTEVMPEEGESEAHVALAVGVQRSRSRFETLVEKATEVGVRAIYPFAAARSERLRLHEARLVRITIAAAKQCGRSRLPHIASVRPFPEVLAESERECELVLLCHEATAYKTETWKVARGAALAGRVTVFIGPEGGFSDGEVDAAAQAGAQLAGLGTRRLRTETAGIVAAARLLIP